MKYKYIQNFHESRKNKIGASDISSLIPNPNIQSESLNAWTDSKGVRHHSTAIDLYNEKINGKEWEYSFPADMGHYLEGKALYEFIADNIDRNVAKEFLRGYQLHEMDSNRRDEPINPEPYNNTSFKHNTEVVTDFGVAHVDCLYDSKDPILPVNPIDMKKDKNGDWILKKNGFTFNLSKPFIIEAKSASSHSFKRRDDVFKGYDLSLKTWQGIPLKHYFQIQYQMALYNVDMAYLTLIYDTNNKHYWQIKANKKHQKELLQLAQMMKNCIDTKTPPKKLVMNSKDIAFLYPTIKEDFRDVQGEELEAILEITRDQKEANKQIKNWKQKETEANERMSLHLKDTEILKGNVNGSICTIAKWKKTGGSERAIGLTDIKKRDDSKRILNYFKKNDLIKTTKENRKPTIVIKSSEME